MPVREVRVESNKAIADYFISLPMRHITRGGKGQREREKRAGMKRTAGAKLAAHGGEYPILEEPLGLFSSGFGVGLTSNPQPADIGLNPTRRAERVPKTRLGSSDGTHPCSLHLQPGASSPSQHFNI